MKNNQYFLNTVLAVVLFVDCAIAMVVRICLPAAVIPQLNIPNMVAISVIALLLEHFLTKGNPRCYICIPVFGAITFGVLPLMAGFACQHDFWKFGLVGGVVSLLPPSCSLPLRSVCSPAPRPRQRLSSPALVSGWHLSASPVSSCKAK